MITEAEACNTLILWIALSTLLIFACLVLLDFFNTKGD